MFGQGEIWECDDERLEQWANDPERAAMLAYLDVLAAWHDQVEQGLYLGIPALHRLPDQHTREQRVERRTMPSGVVMNYKEHNSQFTCQTRPSGVVRVHKHDESASSYVVPAEVRRIWAAAA